MFKIGDIVRSNNEVNMRFNNEECLLERKETGVNYIVTEFLRNHYGETICHIEFFSAPTSIKNYNFVKLFSNDVHHELLELDINYYRKEKIKKLLNG